MTTFEFLETGLEPPTARVDKLPPKWQQTAAGLLLQHTRIDGPDPSEALMDAIKVFQATRGLEVDGVLGPITWSHLAVPSLTRAARGLRRGLEEMYRGAREVGRNNDGPWVEKYMGVTVELPWCVGYAGDSHARAHPRRDLLVQWRLWPVFDGGHSVRRVSGARR